MTSKKSFKLSKGKERKKVETISLRVRRNFYAAKDVTKKKIAVDRALVSNHKMPLKFSES